MASPTEPGKSYFLDPQGRTIAVPSDQYESAVEEGLTPATPEQVAEAFKRREMKERFGGAGGAVAAGAAGLGRTLTLGLTDAIATGTGLVDPETLRGLRDVQPTATGVGTAIGIVAPAIATLGASAPASAAAAAGAAARTGAAATAQSAARTVLSKSAPALITKAGKATERAVAGLLPEATTLGGQIASRAAALGAGSAVEGAWYGLGNVVSEAALGDPELNAGSIASEIGLSALLGGAFGGAMGAGGTALSALAGKAKSRLGASTVNDRLATWLEGFEGERNIKAAGGIQSDVNRATKQIGGERLEDIGREMGELGLVTPFSTPSKTLERAGAMLETTGREIGDFLKAADNAATPETQTAVAQFLREARREIHAPLASNPLQREAANRLAGVLDGYEAQLVGEAGDAARIGLQDLHAIRRDISDALYGLRGTQDPFANSFRESLHSLRKKVSDEISIGVERAGAASKDWRAMNRRFEVASRAQEFAQKGVERSVGNNMISPMEAIGLLGGGVAGTVRDGDISDGTATGLAAMLATMAVRRHGSGVLGAAARFARKEMLAGGNAAKNTIAREAVAQEAVAGKAAARDAAAREAAEIATARARFEQALASDAATAAEAQRAANALQTTAERARSARAALDLAETEATQMRATAGAVSAGPIEQTPMTLAMQKAGLTPAQRGEDLTAALAAHDLDRRVVELRRIAEAVEGEWQDALAQHAMPIMDRVAPVTASAAGAAPPPKVAALARVERAAQNTEKAVNSGVRAILERTADVGKAAARAIAGRAAAAGGGSDDRLTPSTFPALADNLRRLGNDPGAMHERLQSFVDGLDEHAPNAAGALQIQSVRAVTFLASKLPAQPKLGMLGPTLEPSRAEVAKFERYFNAVERPASVLQQVADGTLTAEAVEALRAVHPALYQQMTAALIDRMTEHKGPLPYRTRLMLSLFLGADVDGTTTPEAIRANQQSINGPSRKSDQQQQSPGSNRSGLQGLTLSSRLRTPTQEAAQRR